MTEKDTKNFRIPIFHVDRVEVRLYKDAQFRRQILSQQFYKAGIPNVEIGNSDIESGIYFLNISNAKEQYTLKLMKF